MMIITLLYSTDFFYTVSSIQYVTRVHTYIYIKMNGGRRPNQGRGTANKHEQGQGRGKQSYVVVAVGRYICIVTHVILKVKKYNLKFRI